MKKFRGFRRTPQINVSWLKDDDFFCMDGSLRVDHNFTTSNAKEQFYLISQKYKFYYVDVIT